MLIQGPPREIVEGMWMLGANEYPLYLYRDGQDAAIFEGGVGAMGPLLEEQLGELEIDPATVRQAVVTHAHPDHVMAIPRMQALFPNASVLASEIAAATLDNEKAIGFFRQVDGALTEALLKAGRIDRRHRPEALEAKTIGVDATLAEGDRVAVGGTEFQVLATPGHSECSLSFFQPERRILIISDASGYYMPEDGSWWPNYFSAYGPYVDSIVRLAGLGAEVLCLSHNGAIRGAKDVATYFEGALAATVAYHRRIVDETSQGRSVREIAEKLGAEVYEKAPLLPLDFFQKNCGLLVKRSLKHVAEEA